VLEATTQTLDTHIGAMGSLIHPSTAPSAWLDFVAPWLGLPWDDALSDVQKRNIATHANDILRGRGTRSGLAALLDALLPASRYRIVDTTADYGFTTLGGANGCGARLPAILGGLSIRAAELGSKAILGCMQLPGEGAAEDGTRHLVGRVRVEIAASAGERAQWEPWIASMIDAVAPATARVALRWMPAGSWRGEQLDDTLTLDDAPAAPHLGSDAVTSQVRLPDRQAYLSATGASTGTRLQ
jgi:phage tail-like protein